jgi:phage FluMu protein Com
MICIASVEGCPDCEIEDDWKRIRGHRCGESSDRWSTWCELDRETRLARPEYHRLIHEPVRCDNCKKILSDRGGQYLEKTRMCRSGFCQEWYCPFCDAVQSSAGPVDCPSCGFVRRPVGVRRMRRAYRRRRRFW